MTPWLDDGDVRLYHGDCLEVLRQLPDRSVHMCATSPPFWSLRDYGTEGQIGLEASIDEWVERLVAVFEEVKRVLRDDGSLWLEVGDSFSNKQLVGQPWRVAFALQRAGWFLRSEIIWARQRPNPMPESVTDRPTKSHSTVFLLSKSPRYFYDADAIREAYSAGTLERSYTASKAANFMGAKAQDERGRGENGDGSKPRNVPRAGKPSPQRETLSGLSSVEGVSLSGRTASSAEMTSPSTDENPLTLDGSSGEAPRGPDGRRVTTVVGGENSEQHRNGERWPNPTGANARSVWTIPTEPTPFAHFATWPQALVRRMVLAGTSEKGCCPACGAPWVRDVERELVATPMAAGNMPAFPIAPARRLSWSPSCACYQDGLLDLGTNACTVLDPFAGSATTMLVARNHGRHAIGVELNEAYLEIAAKRLQQLSLLTGTEA